MVDSTALPAPNDSDSLRSRILETALDLAEQKGWDAVHLHDIARLLAIAAQLI